MVFTDHSYVNDEHLDEGALNLFLRDNLKAIGRQGHAGTTDLEVWYPCGAVTGVSGGMTAVSLNANVLYAVPFRPHGNIADRIAFEVMTASATNGRAGIYATKSITNIYPGNLVVDGGSQSQSTTGVKSATISTALDDALYWAVFVQDGNTALQRRVVQEQLYNFLGVGTAPSTSLRTNIIVAFTFAALPSTFPASGTVESSDVPAIYLRYSA